LDTKKVYKELLKKTKIRNYLVSGIGPGPSGVGRLMQNLIFLYKEENLKFIYKRNHISLSSLKSHKKYFYFYYEIILRIFDDILFKLKLFFIKDKRIIIIHPQTIGYKTIIYLLKYNNIFLYVVDNSFFCIRSYNVHPTYHNECLHCLGSLEPHNSCYPEPVMYFKKLNINYLKYFKLNSSKISFLAQNKNQKKLLIKHFGENIKVRVVGMVINELDDDINLNKNSKRYDIVFHGKSIIPKGIIYVLNLAHKLPQFTFMIPDLFANVQKLYPRKITNNVTCHEMSWETGLKDSVINARLVLNPSLWSAPIEGALLKSAYYNSNVGTVISEYGYEGEINIIRNHLRLSSDISIASEQIINFFNNS